ncbi:alkaline phosphatase family protein [Streptosporangium sp. NPDC051023]|uniref:alkaline phosphatase family protein n=1 Tax=Streptosporangium sp. NPDC051023 TaxID=3155410 RepID=UPI00344EAE2D
MSPLCRSDTASARVDTHRRGSLPSAQECSPPRCFPLGPRQDIPLQYELADTFTVCDHYFCSVLSSTSPNRNYHVSGHTGYEPGTTKRAIDNAAYSENTHTGYTWSNAGEILETAGHSWRVYHV